MPIDSRHPEYNEHVEEWIDCRDVVAGERRVKDAGDRYLSRLSGMDEEDYQAYKRRAMFHNASQRTVKGLAGSIFASPPTVEYPGADTDKAIRMANLGDDGQSIESLAQESVENVLTTGRVGVLVDASEQNDAKPYLTLYHAENIVNWETAWIEGAKVLSLVILREEAREKTDDPYELECVEQYRELILVTSESTYAFYRVRIWQQREVVVGDKVEMQWQVIKTIEPTKRGGKKLDYIPFVMISPIGVGVDVEDSPIKDLVSVNLAHYRNSADFEHGCHWTALPTPYAFGFDPIKTKLKIGSGIAWISENHEAKCGMLEFTGSGLAAFDGAMTKKEQLMAVHGARLLEQQTKDAEASKTVAMRHTGENNVLAAIATNVGQGMTQSLTWLVDWEGLSGKASVELSKDFEEHTMDTATLTALMAGMQAGQMSFDVLYFNMHRSGFYPDGWTQEKELEAIQKGPPMPTPGLDDTVGGNDSE